MTGSAIPLLRRLSGWEIREKKKSEPVPIGNARQKVAPSEGTESTSSLPVNDHDDQTDLPPAFRAVTAGQSVRRNSAIRSSTTLDRKVSPPSFQSKGREKESTMTSIAGINKKVKPKKEAKKTKVKKTSNSDTRQKGETTTIDKTGGQKEEKKEVKMPARRRPELLSRKMRSESTRMRSESKKSIWDSLDKFDTAQPFTPLLRRNNSAALKRDPYASKSPEIPDDNSDESLSLDELPPPEREERAAQSLSRSCSLHTRSVSSFNGSMDLSLHLNYPTDDQLKTSASDDQWARFKLLGRLGLGDIKLSREAEALAERNYGIMLNAVKHIYALRDSNSDNDSSVESLEFGNFLVVRTGHLLEEVQATINVPMEGPARLKRDPITIEVDPMVQRQLRDYIVVISSMYRNNPFHDFEHASTVLQAVDKLIGLVSYPDGELDYRNLKHGYGVAREPWNHFSLVFAAMIHDVDHSGVPNAQLVKEGSHVAEAYKNKSVAEQNSIELAWSLLMEPCYKELRESIFQLRSELINFRSLVVTAVMATDIADKELAALRKGRAAGALKAQEDEEHATYADMDLVRRKATFVVETLIQVADVSHTMSSFAVFKNWNKKLYREMYKAYKNGRASQDPTETWYKGEFEFFDFYIIPLAKKLNECGIHGESSAEYLNNAIENRKLWEEKGESLVARYLAELKREETAMEKALAEESSDDSDFADIADPSDDDSISISSDDGEDLKEESRYQTNLTTMRLHLNTQTAGSGKVPSKASIFGSGSERSEARSFLKNRLKTKPKSKLKKTSSASKDSEPPKERRESRSVKKVRRGRRPSRSRSPASSIESGASERKPKVGLKKGKRPSMVKAANIW
jgi:hypothetical protein